ncbi:hypothetical protein E2C01_089543 [Portunus trituberculatus]|uniref:Uncharacterized protein n=1 Tax=Portunus trituberculatus TaxID=210409 RepID=A0A5B7JJA8_PORTR|nr:hypothetical protein [Portunus trituberculatus]
MERMSGYRKVWTTRSASASTPRRWSHTRHTYPSQGGSATPTTPILTRNNSHIRHTKSSVGYGLPDPSLPAGKAAPARLPHSQGTTTPTTLTLLVRKQLSCCITAAHSQPILLVEQQPRSPHPSPTMPRRETAPSTPYQ